MRHIKGQTKFNILRENSKKINSSHNNGYRGPKLKCLKQL